MQSHGEFGWCGSERGEASIANNVFTGRHLIYREIASNEISTQIKSVLPFTTKSLTSRLYISHSLFQIHHTNSAITSQKKTVLISAIHYNNGLGRDSAGNSIPGGKAFMVRLLYTVQYHFLHSLLLTDRGQGRANLKPFFLQWRGNQAG